MKKILFLVLNILFILNVKAATSLKTYDDALSSSKTYISSFKDNDKYIIEGSGNLLKENDFLIGKDYLYNGLNFWITSNNTSKYSIIDPTYKNNDYINDTLSKTDTSGIRVVVSAQNYARVSGEGTRLNPWEFTKRQYEVKIIVENGNVATTPIYITEGQNKSVSVTSNNGYAYDSVSCTNDQVGVYENGKLKIKSIANNTVCTVKFVNPSKEITYKEEEQEYEVKYDGYYKIDAYGAQGKDTISGKGGHTYGIIYLNSKDVLKITTGGQNGYNGGGSGYYNGGGSTVVKLWDNNLMTAAGGGGGKNGTPGGSGNSKGGESVGNGAGSDGINRGGGGSGYDYSYSYGCSDCYYGHNTCKGGTILYNCNSCKTGHNTCVAGYDETNCSSCYTGHNTCVDKVETTSECETWERVEGDHFVGYNYFTCKNGYWSYTSATNRVCTGRNASKYSYCPSKSGKCSPDGSTTSVTCDGQCSWDVCRKYKTKITKCATGENTCAYGCDKTYNSCKTGENTCAYGCDSVYSSCKTGENTCSYGCSRKTVPYNSGNGGSNLLSDKLEDSKSESGKNAGNGFVKISYYKEK